MTTGDACFVARSQQEGVDVAAPVRPSAATRSAVVFVDRSSGRRAIVESRDSALDMGADEISADTLCSGRIILVDGTDMPLSLRAATAARRAGLRTMVDLDRRHPATMQLLSEIDVVILPEALVQDLTATRQQWQSRGQPGCGAAASGHRRRDARGRRRRRLRAVEKRSRCRPTPWMSGTRPAPATHSERVLPRVGSRPADADADVLGSA